MSVKPFSWNFYEDALKVAKLLGYGEPNEALIDLYKNQGWTINYLAKTFDRTPMAIHVKLKKLGVQMRPQGGYHR